MPCLHRRRHSLPGTLAALAVLSLLMFASSRRLGLLPPLAPFLDPVRGVWSVARQAASQGGDARVSGLGAPVAVHFDDRRVPHIFAASELDAVRALGYVVARDRLFQLEVQWRAGAGRLTELVGPLALRSDRDSRALGLPMAAGALFAAMPDTSRERRLLEAFAGGVNTWISRSGPRDRPLEYHLLGRQPSRWEAVNSLHVNNRMGWTLARSNLEALREAAARLVGREAAEALYPRNSPIQEPLQPGGRPAPRFDSTPLPPPAAGDTGALALHDHRLAPPAGALDDALGSNNWAVSPARTAAGWALLAGDQHLELTLPSTWYEAHLVVPDSLDVYGVTIPGAPAVVIGFNRDVAWTFTNTEADVLDRYAEVVDDPDAPSRYQLDGGWRAVGQTVEEYRDRSGRVIAVDTLRRTHRGPLSRDDSGRWISLRWTVLEANRALGALSRSARSRTAVEWLDHMLDFRVPAQNMLVADRQGRIAIRSTGRFPLRPGGRGDVLQSGEASAVDWTGEWSVRELPQAVDPAQGYLASANQQPVDPLDDGRYLGANWYAPWRALRINGLLRSNASVTPDDMRRFQTDPGSAAADIFVPHLLSAARGDGASPDVQRAGALLARWDRRYTRDNTGAVLFEAVLRELNELLWDELRPTRQGLTRPPFPTSAITAVLLSQPASRWWDQRETPERVEQRDDILRGALARGLAAVVRAHGEPEGGGWRWDRVRQVQISHLLYVPALSAEGVVIQGGQHTLNPASGDGRFGSSWRMVVELGPSIRGWGIFPGGQSGNPASAWYADRVERWSEGELDTLRFPSSPAGLAGQQSDFLMLTPAP